MKNIKFFINELIFHEISSEVYSVNVAAPSSVESPRTNPKSKSLMSYDKLMGLNCSFSRLSCKICLFIIPRLAIFPLLSNFKDVFVLIQLSIRQLPGPISLLYIPDKLSLFVTMVIFEMPPIFKKQVGSLNFLFDAIS